MRYFCKHHRVRILYLNSGSCSSDDFIGQNKDFWKNQHPKINILSSFIFQFEASKLTVQRKIDSRKYAFGSYPLYSNCFGNSFELSKSSVSACLRNCLLSVTLIYLPIKWVSKWLLLKCFSVSSRAGSGAKKQEAGGLDHPDCGRTQF